MPSEYKGKKYVYDYTDLSYKISEITSPEKLVRIYKNLLRDFKVSSDKRQEFAAKADELVAQGVSDVIIERLFKEYRDTCWDRR